MVNKNNTHKYIDKFDGPIPGQSMTERRGKYPFDNPPQYTDPEEALDVVFQNMLKPRASNNLLSLLEQDIPVNTIVESLLVSGFGEGKWSAPMVPIMAGPMTAMVMGIAKQAGIKPTISDVEDTSNDIPDTMIMNAKHNLDKKAAKDSVHPVAAGVTGLMAPTVEEGKRYVDIPLGDGDPEIEIQPDEFAPPISEMEV